MGPQCVVWGLGGEDKKTETGPDQIISQGQKAGTVCSRFFIFLLMNRLAVCLGLHTAPWYSRYCTASNQTNSTFWARALSVSMLHNQDGLSINRSSSSKYQPPPVDKHCLSRHTHSVSLHVHTLLCCTYTHFVSPRVPTLSLTHITPSPAHSYSYIYWKKSKTLEVLTRPILDF